MPAHICEILLGCKYVRYKLGNSSFECQKYFLFKIVLAQFFLQLALHFKASQIIIGETDNKPNLLG